MSSLSFSIHGEESLGSLNCCRRNHLVHTRSNQRLAGIVAA